MHYSNAEKRKSIVLKVHTRGIINMSNRCWICKRTDDFMLNQKNELLKEIDKELEECSQFKEHIYEKTKNKLGFNDENKKRVEGIKSEFLNMTISAVIENKENFLKLEPNLEILMNYYSKYFFQKRNINRISDIRDSFIQEPLESRYSSEVNANKSKEDTLLSKRAELEEIPTIFVGKPITTRFIDSKLSTCYSYLGFQLNKQILLCPICASLFKESANASFELKQAKLDEEKQKWEDDDDDDWE